VTLDFDLVHGVLVKGRVTDKATGKPVVAAIFYAPLADNRFFKDLPGKEWYLHVSMSARTKADGTFTFLVVPGSGLLRIRAEDEAMGRYTEAVLDPAHRSKAYREDSGLGQSFLTAGGAIDTLSGHHAYRLIDPSPDADTLECNVELERGLTRTGTVVGPDGKPLAGATVLGLVAIGGTRRLAEATFTATTLNPARPRLLAFVQKERKLAGYVRVRGDEKEPVVVKLRPWGAIAGRAFDEEGNPLADARVNVHYAENNLRWLFDEGRKQVKTDRDGRFRVDGLYPDVPIGLNFTKKGRFRVLGERYDKIPIRPGETKNLGDLRTRPFPVN
jgi:protocatechuate 3,4-dioxygenase beta subunit